MKILTSTLILSLLLIGCAGNDTNDYSYITQEIDKKYEATATVKKEDTSLEITVPENKFIDNFSGYDAPLLVGAMAYKKLKDEHMEGLMTMKIYMATKRDTIKKEFDIKKLKTASEIMEVFNSFSEDVKANNIPTLLNRKKSQSGVERLLAQTTKELDSFIIVNGEIKSYEAIGINEGSMTFKEKIDFFSFQGKLHFDNGKFLNYSMSVDQKETEDKYLSYYINPKLQ